jgi:predicted RNA-binding Zn-ribbon protein involved in translation (DUF1610 family)
MKSNKYVCPICNKKSVVKIVYGYPSQELLDEAIKKEVVLGGCIVDEANPEFQCLQCGNQW